MKMNIGGEKKLNKKRSALKDIDGNSKKQKVEKGLPVGCVMEGDWMVIKVSYCLSCMSWLDLQIWRLLCLYVLVMMLWLNSISCGLH